MIIIGSSLFSLATNEQVYVFRADCFDVFPLISDKSVDMILCDLPYGTTQNKYDVILPFDKLWVQYERIIKDNGYRTVI